MSKTIIVSNRLPISIKISEEGILQYESSAGGLATGLGSIYKKGNNIWIGWPGIYLERPNDEVEVASALKNENMAPIFLTALDIEQYYEGFSNMTLWPLFHYFPKTCVYLEKFWKSYIEVNQKFCDAILQHAEPTDIIWVHDYQLLLLPGMLRQALPDATIGFFNHIPFPSYEIFRLLPWRSEILKGMIGADLIGFHTYDDVRHFLSSVSRILGKDNKMAQIRIENRICNVDSFPMGIDYQKFDAAARTPATLKEIETYKSSLGDRKLIISIDRLDYSKGIPERLNAFTLFLQKYPQYHNQVTMILVVVPSRDQVDLYQKLKIEIDEMVGRINGKFGNITWTPIRYFYRSFPFQTLSAFYSMSDIALVTPLRDGMNLVCKEYIASKIDKRGVLILSEMAGAAKELSEALIINPNNIGQMADALQLALEMPEAEQIRRNDDLQSILQRYDIHHWVEIFMQRLNYTKARQTEMAVRKITTSIREKLIADFTQAEKRIIFLDYDGTLMAFNSDPQKVRPDKELLQLLQQLALNKKNKVVIISGRDKDTLDEWLGHLPLDMVAEHGVWLKEGRIYWSMMEYITDEWKSEIRPILQLFVDRTPGSFIETKDYSLVWHFRKAEADLGELRARELVDTLQYLTTNMAIKVLEGNKVLEIKNADINKGKAAARWLQEDYSFIMAAGDDWTDEEMFAAMPESAYTIKIGYSSSGAKYNLASCNNDSCPELRGLLQCLAEADIVESVSSR